MTWYVIQNQLGELSMIPSTESIPDGYTLVVTTANPDYLTYMAEVSAAP